jgi:hypothetical protein
MNGSLRRHELTELAGHPELGPLCPCGMGNTPDISRQFLRCCAG